MGYWTKIGVTSLLAISLSACATASKMTISDRLQELGLSKDRAKCMAEGLENRLTTGELSKVADYMDTLSKQSNQVLVVKSLGEIDDARLAGAIAGAGVTCLITG